MSDVLLPPFDQQLHDNFCSTDYSCQYFRITPGASSSEFIDLLYVNNWSTYTFLTAFNPFSLIRTLPEENRQAQNLLLAELIDLDLTFFPAVAQDQDQKWPPEPGFFIFNMTLSNALSLAAKFQQHAILWGTTSTLPSVLWTHGRLPDR